MISFPGSGACLSGRSPVPLPSPEAYRDAEAAGGWFPGAFQGLVMPVARGGVEARLPGLIGSEGPAREGPGRAGVDAGPALPAPGLRSSPCGGKRGVGQDGGPSNPGSPDRRHEEAASADPSDTGEGRRELEGDRARDSGIVCEE